MNIDQLKHEAGRASEMAEALAARHDKPQLVALCALLVDLQSLTDSYLVMATKIGAPDLALSGVILVADMKRHALDLAGVDPTDPAQDALRKDFTQTSAAIYRSLTKD